MSINGRIIFAGGIATALIAIGTVAAWGVPLLAKAADSGPLPLAGRTEVSQLATQLQQLQQLNAKMANDQANANRQFAQTIDQMHLEFLQQQYTQMQAQSSNPMARQILCSLIDQMDPIRQRLGLVPIPPCSR